MVNMIECKTKLKKWGNSLGVVIPKEEIRKSGLRPHQTVRVLVSPAKTTKVKDIFGKLKAKKPTKQIMREIDEELDIEF